MSLRVRKGFLNIFIKNMKKLRFDWILRQIFKYFKLFISIKFLRNGKTITSPVILHLFSTNKCNLRCWMCDIPLRKSNYHLTTDDIFWLLEESKKLGISGVSFTGGEPLVRKDIISLLKKAKELDLEVMLVTNGILLDKFIDALLEINIDVIMISIDGSTPEIHNKSRQSNLAFDKAISNIKMLREKIDKNKKLTEIAVSTVISEDNIEDIENIITLCKKIGVNRIIFCPVHFFKNNKSIPLKLNNFVNIGEKLLKSKDRWIIDNSDQYLKELDKVLMGNKSSLICTSAYTTLFVDWEFNLYICKAHLETGRKFLNLKDIKNSGGSIKKLWYSNAYNQMRIFCKKCNECFLTVNREFDTLFNIFLK